MSGLPKNPGPESGAVGQGCGLLVIGWTARSLPLFGGVSYVDPVVATFFCTQGAAGLGGDGSWSLFGPPPPALVIGATLVLQAGVFDPGAAAGIALSNALTVTIGG